MGISIEGVHNSSIQGLSAKINSIPLLPNYSNNDHLVHLGNVRRADWKYAPSTLEIELAFRNPVPFNSPSFYEKLIELKRWLFHRKKKVRIQVDGDPAYYLGFLDQSADLVPTLLTIGKVVVIITVDAFRYIDRSVELLGGFQANVLQINTLEESYPRFDFTILEPTSIVRFRNVYPNGLGGNLTVSFTMQVSLLTNFPITIDFETATALYHTSFGSSHVEGDLISGRMFALQPGLNTIYCDVPCVMFFREKV